MRVGESVAQVLLPAEMLAVFEQAFWSSTVERSYSAGEAFCCDDTRKDLAAFARMLERKNAFKEYLYCAALRESE